MSWTSLKISSVAEIVSGGTPKSGTAEYWGGDVQWLTPSDMGKMKDVHISETSRKISMLGLAKSSAKLIPPFSVILSTRAPIGHLAINTVAMATNQGCRGLIPKSNINTKYLYYFLLKSVDLLNKLGTGTTFKELSKSALEKVEIPIPQLDEQKRIVAILDQVFADIDQARATAESNLKNARELFDSYLEKVAFSKNALGKYVAITTGKLDSNAAVEDGIYPFFTCSRDVFAINSYAFDCEAILLAGNNAAGDFNVKHYSGKFNAYQRTYVITINDENQLNYRFLYFQMLKSLKELKKSSVGAGTKFLKIGMIKNLEISVPPIGDQIKLVANIDMLNTHINELTVIYKRKLASLDELKKSILQKAFTGELTKSKGIAA